MVIAKLTNDVAPTAPAVYNNEVVFDITILNDCANDSIQFNNVLPATQTIYLFAGLTPITFDPAVSQFNKACKRTCSYVLPSSHAALLQSFSSQSAVAVLSSTN